MSSAIQRRRGTTAQHATFAGLNAELTVDTDKEVVVVHDGTTAGGYPLMRENGSNSALALGSAATPSLKWDANTGIYSPGADQLAISTNSSQRLVVDASGNVGVGISPSALMHVSSSYATPSTGGISANTRLIVSNNNAASSEANISLLYRSNAKGRLNFGSQLVEDVAYIEGGTNYLAFGAGLGSVSANERLRITSAGLVGVGTSSPQANLDISTSASRYVRAFPSSGLADFEVLSNNNSQPVFAIKGTGTADLFRAFANTTQAVTIKSSGNVGIGTSAPNSPFEVGTDGINLDGAIAALPAAGADSAAFIARTASTGSAPFDQAGSIIYRPRVSSTTGRSSHIFYTGSPSTIRMVIDETGKVGIGTSSPTEALSVVGTLVSTGTTSSAFFSSGNDVQGGNNPTFTMKVANSRIGYLKWKNAAGTDHWGIYSPMGAAGQQEKLSFRDLVGGQDRMVITPAGLVGIGTTGPAAALHVVAGGTAAYFISNASSAGVSIGSDTNLGKIGTNGSTCNLAFNIDGAEKARIDTSGRFLVGTSSGSLLRYGVNIAKIETNSTGFHLAMRNDENSQYSQITTFVRSRNNAIVQSGDGLGDFDWRGHDGTDVESVAASIGAFVDGTPGANDMPGRLVFSTTADGASSPTERMRIRSDGRLLTFSSSNSAIVGSTATAAGGAAAVFELNHSATSTTNGTNCFYVLTNGDVRNTNNSYGAISDIKLKENIVDASSQWDDLKALQVRNYNFKPETNQETHTQIGLVAQEVELVSPGLVSESPDRDKDGNDLGTVTKSVNYSVLYMKAVKALQEAMERIETLEASNTGLLARVTALESA